MYFEVIDGEEEEKLGLMKLEMAVPVRNQI